MPFSTETPADLAKYRAVLENSLGNITLELMPDVAPNHVRNFLRLSDAGVYDRTAFHRIVPGFMIQTGYLGSKTMAMDEAQQKLVGTLEPEFEALSDGDLRAKTVEFKQRLENGESLEDVIFEAYAAVREAFKRTIGVRLFDVQLMGEAGRVSP